MSLVEAVVLASEVDAVQSTLADPRHLPDHVADELLRDVLQHRDRVAQVEPAQTDDPLRQRVGADVQPPDVVRHRRHHAVLADLHAHARNPRVLDPLEDVAPGRPDLQHGLGLAVEDLLGRDVMHGEVPITFPRITAVLLPPVPVVLVVQLLPRNPLDRGNGLGRLRNRFGSFDRGLGHCGGFRGRGERYGAFLGLVGLGEQVGGSFPPRAGEDIGESGPGEEFVDDSGFEERLVGVLGVVAVAEEDAGGALEEGLAVPTLGVVGQPLDLGAGVRGQEDGLASGLQHPEDLGEELGDLAPGQVLEAVGTVDGVELGGLEGQRLLEGGGEVHSGAGTDVHVDVRLWVPVLAAAQFEDPGLVGLVELDHLGPQFWNSPDPGLAMFA